MLKTLNRKLNPPRDLIPARYENELFTPVRALFTDVWRRIKPVVLARFKPMLRPETKLAPTMLDVVDIPTDPNVKRFIARFMAQIDNSAKRARFDVGADPADDWIVNDDAFYDQIAAQQIKLCQATVTEIVAATGMKANEIDARLRSVMMDQSKTGATLLEITRELEKWFSGESAYRARRIAHTESARAHNYGYLKGTENADEVVGYEWVLSADACPLCHKIGLDADGLPRQVAKGKRFAFDAKDKTPWIYKSVYAPPLHPNCRCAVVAVLDFEPTRFSNPVVFGTTEGDGFIMPGPPTVGPPKINLDIEPPPPKPRKPRTPKPKQPVAPTPVPVETVTGKFPSSPTVGLELVKKLGGSTGAELVRDPATGELFVRKYGKSTSDDHLRSEFQADEIYRALGVPVPDSMLYETSNGAVKLARYIDGAKSIADLKRSDRAAYDAAIERMKRDFAADAILGNWDVFGMAGDNVLVAPDGTPYRVDNGGALAYRAQGALKSTLGPKLWTDQPIDLWNIPDKNFNKTTAPDMLETMTAAQRWDSVGRLPDPAALRLPDTIPADVAARIKARIENAGVALGEYRLLTDDRFMETHADEFARASMNIKNADVLEHVGKTKMNAKYNKTRNKNHASGSLEDENGHGVLDFYGNATKNYKGDPNQPNSPFNRFMDLVEQNHVKNWRQMSRYMGEQAGSSSSDMALAVKKLWTERVVKYADPDNELWWHRYDQSNINAFKQRYFPDKSSEDGFLKAAAWQHAYTYNLLRALPLPYKSKDNNRIALVRTIGTNEMRLTGKSIGDKNVKSTRGLLESFGMATVFSETVATIQSVPIHRGFVSYLQGKDRNDTRALLGNGESELVTIGGGDVEYDTYTQSHAVTNLVKLLTDKAKQSSGVKP